MPKFRLQLLILCLLFFNLLFPNNVQALFIRTSSQPLIPIISNTWENIIAANPTVFIDNNLFKIYYTGADTFSTNGKFQIGYANSTDGIIFNKDINNPIIKWDFVSNTNVGIQHPNIITRITNNNKIYQLWFSNIDTNIDFFELYYSDSTDGYNWSSPINIQFNTPTSAWELRGRVDPSVIYDESTNTYTMWYSGRDSSGNWKVGQATSADKINWSKSQNPVLTATLPWEGVGVGNVSVIRENGKYHMFYSADTDIGYASSDDGISWTKFPDPILSPDLSDSSNFDYTRVADPSTVKYNGEYYLYYVGRNLSNQWQIGLAKSSVFPGEPEISTTPTPSLTSIPTPTITLSPTPTPTLSSTPTLTPTSTSAPTPTSGPPPFSPIIIIPGLGGSWNPADIFSCNPSTGGSWTATPFVNVYDKLINTLTKKVGLKMDKDVYLYTYDWRQPLPTQSTRLKKFIDQILSGRSGAKVKLVGHSLGGLVIRSYLTDYWSEEKIESAMTVGSPHSGTVMVYPLWEAGEMPKEFSIFNIVLNQIVHYCRIDPLTLQTRSEREVVQKLVPVTKSLLPTFDYLYKNQSVIPVVGMISQNDWLNLHPLPSQHFFIPFQTLTGSGFKTLLSYSVKSPSAKDILAGNWLDGKTVDKTKSTDGDGAILLISATDPQLPNQTIQKNHGQLISSKEGVAKILAFLNIPAPFIDLDLTESINQKTLSVSVDKPVLFTLIDPEKSTDSQNQLLILANPSFGNYRIRIKGERNEKARITISLFIDGEDPINVDYTFSLKKNKTSEISFGYPDDSSFAPKIITIQ